MQRKIITDSGCDLNKELLNNDIIDRAPFNLEIDGIVYIDTPDLDRTDYLNKMEKYSKTPITAAPSPQYYYDIFKGANESFALSISAKLSGSYNSAMTAKNMIEEEFSDKKIHIFDTKTAAAGQTLLTYKLAELVESGLDFDAIIEKMNNIIEETKTYFFLQSFDNLVKTGRTNPTIASIAKLLSISIVGNAVDGEIQLLDKVRGKKKAITNLVKLVTESNVNFSEKILSISHVDALETATILKDLILEKANFKEVIIQETSGLCTNYGAREGIIIAF